MTLKNVLATSGIALTVLLAACGNNASDTAKEKENKTESTEKAKTTESKTADKGTLEGTFSGQNKEEVEGKATIKDGELKLTDYKSSKGPDLHVYLTKGGDIKGGKEIAEVPYDKDTQTFDVKGVDLSKYDEVTIYCKKAHVTFGAAKIK